MSRNNWYAQQDADGPVYNSPDPSMGRVAADSVQDAHKLFSVYPFASATPSTHVARHLSSLTISANTPSYIQPLNYAGHSPAGHQSNYAPYSEYSNEFNHLGAPQAPSNDGGYWRDTRNDALRFLGETGAGHSLYQPPNWNPSPSYPSSYHTNAFAHSIFQHTASSASYPTPPPPGISLSSSSLAFALGEPKPKPKPTRPVYRPDESAGFFNEFLAQTGQKMQFHEVVDDDPNVTPTRSRTVSLQDLQDSPDPLTLGPLPPSVPALWTPRKRKPVEQMNSPTLKRVQLSEPSGSSPIPPSPSSAMNTPISVPSKLTLKRKMQAYVEVPPLPVSWRTPSPKRHGSSSSVKMNVDDDDYLSEDDALHRRGGNSSSVRSSAKRTGGRDERVPLEKLAALFEDIFEAEDALPPDASAQDLPAEYFSASTVDCARPLLHSNIIRKLTKNIGKVSRPTKRVRLSAREGGGGTPRGKGGIAEIETATLSRILKMLERNVKAGEDLEPFGGVVACAERKPSSPTKAGKGAKKALKNSKTTSAADERRSTSQTPKTEGDAAGEGAGGSMVDDGVDEVQALTEADFDQLTRILEIAKDSILAADCCIALLGSDRLQKQLYSEELITECFNTIKNQLTKIIYPFVEACTDLHGSMHPLLRHVIDTSSHTSREHRRLLGETFQALSAVLPRINNLICAEVVAMSESIIIQAVFIAIGPFFVMDSGNDGEGKGKGKKENVIFSTFGSKAMGGLRLEALSLIRGIFANNEDQRSWIIEEILTSLIKLSDVKQKAGQFRLRDGRSIRTVSALLMQLVQTSAHDVRLQARKLGKARQQAIAMRRQESFNEQADEPFLDDKDTEEIRLYTSGLESASKVAKTVVLFLTQRSGKTKITKNSNEAEYRSIFDNLISDLLAVLFWPEWPAAALLLSVICKFMVSSLDDIKTINQNDSNNAAKTMALDHLGVIASRLRSSALKYRTISQVDTQASHHGLRPLDEILSSANTKELNRLLAAYHDVVSHLCKRSSEDQAYDSARELTAAAWGQDLAYALKQIDVWISEPDDEEFDPKVDRTRLVPFALKIKDALRDVWKDPTTDVFDIGSQDEVVRVDRLAEEIGTIQGLKNSFQPILNKILLALDAPPVFMRTKALRALGQIVTSDPTILSSDNVRRAIEGHLLDSSPAVRDAAVELIGKYMIDSPEVAGHYYQKIADRIADTGLGVRKRVIKLLKSFYGVISDLSRRVDICTRLVLRMFDEDDSVKDLAVKTMEELWFQNASSMFSQNSRTPVTPVNTHDRSPLLLKVAVIMGVSANFKDRQSPLEDMLHKIMVDKDGNEAVALHERYAEICETLIDGLVDASDLPGFTVVNCVRTIYLFTSAYPPVLSGANASTLLPYLKNATTLEEQTTSDYLLKIFRASVPHMPKTAAKFGQDLQLSLQPMIIKPSSTGGVQTLQETVACVCAVVSNLTHDFSRLVALLKSCNARLQQAIARPKAKVMTPVELRALNILVFIVALLGEHCDFDRLRLENEALVNDLNTISNGPIVEHIYSSLLRLYEKYTDASLRGRILQCLGFLFRAQPTLMTVDSSSTVMDAIFSSSEEEPRGRLLKIIQDFLISEASKHSSKEKGAKGKPNKTDVNMDELVGNTDGFADSGVSSAIVQRYLDPILQAALSQNVQVQAPAVDILSFTIKQGLAHPLQSFPVIVALETSPNSTLASRANALHHILHNKHASLLNSRYIISARASFDYQRKLSSSHIQGYRMLPNPTALLQRWYSLIREKRAPRLDFLKALTKVFDVPASLQSTQDEIDFIRYMAENFSVVDYKTLEEVLTVVRHLTSLLSTAGMQLVEMLSPSHLLSQLHGSSRPVSGEPPAALQTDYTSVQAAVVATMTDDKLPMLRGSVVIAMIMLLKAFLKSLYGLSEEKCSKWVPGKKSAIGDKPATKRHERPIVWDRLPFATRPILTSDDMDHQRTRFLEIWSEDGLTIEPEEDFS